jgi:lysozyme
MGTDGVDRLQQLLTVCPGADTVPGIDVSHWNGAIDWALVADAGVRWAYAKATESTSYSDPTFETHWAGMKRAGVLRGAYHFFHPDVDGRTQAAAFLAAVGELEPGDLPPMLDWESTTSVSGAAAASRAQDFIDEVRAATGRTTLVYTSPGLWARFGIPTSFDAQPLWVAHYLYCTSGPGCCPTVPSGWTGWAAWQWSDQGRIAGIPDSEVDLDLFNGTLDELRALTVELDRDAGSPTATGGGGGSVPGADAGPGAGDDGARLERVVGGCGCGEVDGTTPWLLGLGALSGGRRRRRDEHRSPRLAYR